jgi:hypothetical protein
MESQLELVRTIDDERTPGACTALLGLENQREFVQ